MSHFPKRTREPADEDSDRLRKYAISHDCTEEEFIAASKLYAREIAEVHNLNVRVSDLNWEVSKRAKRRAGAVFYRNEEAKAVRLTWEYFAKKGWEGIAAIIRHELIHIHLITEEGDADHGPRFRQLAQKLNTAVHCEKFAEPKWVIACESCGSELYRYRASKVVKRPDQYQCGDCGGSLTVDQNR